MNIAIFTPYNIFKHGGVQEHVTNQALELRKRGHQVTILTPRPRFIPRSVAPPENTIFIGVSARIKAPHATSADISASLDNDSIDEILSQDFDILHVHEPLAPIAARQLLARAEGRAVRVGTFHAALPGNTLGRSLVGTYKTYARNVLPHIDVITAVSPAAIGYIKDYTDSSITYIPNGIQTKVYSPQSKKRDQSMVLFIGRLEKRKGARQLIKAYEHLKLLKPDTHLVVAGDGPQRKSLEKFVAEYDIPDIEFLGFVDEKVKLELLGTCGIYTSPALYGESFGIVLVEAMAMQAPIVCHPNEGYKWVMQGTGRLSLVDCSDAVAYAERMQLMLEDTALRDLWQDWAKTYVTRFDYEQVVDQYEALYAQAVQ